MLSQETHLQSLLDQLRTRLLIMCAIVEKTLADACTALCENNAELANAVIEADDRIDALENEVDEMALFLLACSQPVARDLRFVVSALRMVIDLERIGDEVAAIAKRVSLLQDTLGLPALLIRRMMDMAQSALHDALTAFREEDVPLALQVCHGKDDIIELEVRLLQSMMNDPGKAAGKTNAANEATLHTILIARSISRIFGRASNIAEHCYFMEKGANIKHKKAAPLS